MSRGFFLRNPLPTAPVEKVEQIREDVTNLPEHWLQAKQQRDPEIIKLIEDLREHRMEEIIAKTYEVRFGVLHRQVQRKPPNDLLLTKVAVLLVLNLRNSISLII